METETEIEKNSFSTTKRPHAQRYGQYTPIERICQEVFGRNIAKKQRRLFKVTVQCLHTAATQNM